VYGAQGRNGFYCHVMLMPVAERSIKMIAPKKEVFPPKGLFTEKINGLFQQSGHYLFEVGVQELRAFDLSSI
jgi:hypothetical protein